MKIQVSGKGIHRREVVGIDKLRALPAEWYCFTNLELVDSGAMPRQIDVIIVLDDRILIVDLKDWNGRIASDSDRWFLNGKSVDTSPVKKILENVRIIAGLLQRYLKKDPQTRTTPLPLIEGCVVTTGRCDLTGLAPMEKPRVFQIDEFCKIVQDQRTRSSRLATPNWIDKTNPLTGQGSRWRSDLSRFFGIAEGFFKPLEKRYGDYKVVSDQTYEHPKHIYSEYDVEETTLSHGFGLLRLWDFSNASSQYCSEEGRMEVAGREQDVISFLLDRQPELETALIRPRVSDPDKGIHYWEVFERRRQLRRLREFLVSHSDELTTTARFDLARMLLSHIATMHRIGAAHLDIGDHSVWLELPSIIRLSHLVAASYQGLASLGTRRFEFLANGTILPEHILDQEIDHFRKDVFLLGVVIHSIVFGTPPRARAAGDPPSWDPSIDVDGKSAFLHEWFAKSLDISPAARFCNSQEMLDSFNECLRQSGTGPNALERLERFRRWKSLREVFREFPEDRLIRETDRNIVWTTIKDDKTLLVKTWRRSCWGDDDVEAPRIVHFCETAEELILAEHPGLVRLLNVGYVGESLVLVQEFVNAPNLSSDITDRPEFWSSVEVVLQFISRLVDLVIDLHDRGFAHGDLKPANILVIEEQGFPSPLLVDFLDFIPMQEGELHTPSYSPLYPVGTRERDRFAVLKVSEELLSKSSLEPPNFEALRAAIETCREGTPPLATLTPFREELQIVLNPPLEEAETPKCTFSFPGIELGPVVSDDGCFYIRRIESTTRPKESTVHVTGRVERVVIDIRTQFGLQIKSVGRHAVTQSQVSSAERRAGTRFHGRFEVVPGPQDLASLRALLLQWFPELEGKATGVEDLSSADANSTPSQTGIEEDLIVEDVQTAPSVRPVNVNALWETLLAVEEEQFTTCLASADSTFVRDKRRHFVPVDIKAGTIDFTREDKVIVEFNGVRGWSPIGVLDLDLTKGGFIAVDASLYRARDGALLCRTGSELRFKSMMETDSRTRRTSATKRILGRRSVLPNLIDYLSDKISEPKLTSTAVDRHDLESRYGLNASQSDAFVRLLSMRPLGLLQGPPGTGKTTFIASLVHYLLSTGLISNVLLASQSHEAVNNATESILKLFRHGNIEPSLVRVGQEGQISELLRPYHSAKVEAHYREKFKAGLKRRFQIAAHHLGLKASFSDDLFFLESTLRPVMDHVQALLKAEDQSADDGRCTSLCATLEDILLRLELDIEKPVDWSEPEVYDQLISLLMVKHRVTSADQVRRMRGIANLTRDWMGQVSNRRRSFEEFLANTRHIVAGTCVGLGRSSLGLSTAQFDLVIIDEAARCTPSELCVPIQSGKWILLVGDHLQLEPFHEPAVLNEARRRLRISMPQLVRSDFDRCFSSAYGKVSGQTLTIQYRMLPSIGRLVSSAFYKGVLEHGRKMPIAPDTIWPAPLSRQLLWIATDELRGEAYQHLDAHRSLSNPMEANAIADLLRELDSHKPFIDWLLSQSPDETPIGIICMYSAQAQLMRQKLRSIGLSGTLLNACKVDTVDSYQGKQNLLVILSLVRNNEDGEKSGTRQLIKPGFLSRPNRINVALSRAMDRLVIVGASVNWTPGSPMNVVSRIFDEIQKDGSARLTQYEPIQTEPETEQPHKRKPRRSKKIHA